MRVFKTKWFGRYALRARIDDEELTTFKEMAVAWFKASEQEINRSLSNGLLQEVNYDKET